MSSAVRQWFGCEKPKQFCTFIGTRSLLQHTIDRVDCLVPPKRRVLVVAEQYESEIERQLEGRKRGVVVLQPVNCDTAAGLFLGLARVRARDPRAIVAVFPSDHFVYPEDAFLREMRRAISIARALEDRIVVVGARPDGADADYGWIEPHRDPTEPAWPVRAFVEKPAPARAREALARGGVWNTLILIARLEAFYTAGRKALPEIATRFDLIAGAIGTSRERGALAALYHSMPARNLSSALLARIPERLVVFVMKGVVWSDWGRPERIVASASRLRRHAGVPLARLSEAGVAALAPMPAEEETCEW
jgi:mannose-1-phosphate guanylyltransferase